MANGRKIGTPYQEALRGLCGQVQRIFRDDVDHQHEIDASLIQGDTIICLSVRFLASGREAWVPLELGAEGWSEQRRQRIVHEASHVIGKLLAMEKFAGAYVNSQLQGVLDAYR